MWDACHEHLAPLHRSGGWLIWNPREGPRDYWKTDPIDPRDAERGRRWYEVTLRLAHEADPDARLVLLNFNDEIASPKSDTMFELCRGLRYPGRPLHGGGFQMHINTEYKRQQWRRVALELGAHSREDDNADLQYMDRNSRRFASLRLEV